MVCHTSTRVSRFGVFVSSSVNSDLVQAILASIGPDACAFTTVEEADYRRLSRGNRRQRIRLRLLTWIVHPCRLALSIVFARRGSLYIVTTNPFTAPVVAAALGPWFGVRVVHHVFDLYPDALEAAGILRPGGFLSRSISACLGYAHRRCAGAVYLGQALRRQTERRLGQTPHSAVIEVTADEALFGEPSPGCEGCLVVHYGGQLGTMHDAESIVAAVEALEDERYAGRVRFDFRVGGARAQVIDRLRGKPGVVVDSIMPPSAWRKHVRGAGVGLVSLLPAGARVCLPSKTYALLAASLPVIAICPRTSDLAAVVTSQGAGWVIENAVSPASVSTRDRAVVGAEIAALIRRLIALPAERDQRAEAAGQAARTVFSRAATAARWRTFLSEFA